MTALTPGSMIDGRYRVLGTLGQGGFGAVYKAEDLDGKRLCAIKVLLDPLLWRGRGLVPSVAVVH